jgi:hypothetical protein
MNYEQLKARIRAYGVKCGDIESGFYIAKPQNLSPEDEIELHAFLTVATACFVFDLAGKPIPDDLTDFIMGAKDEARSA